MTFGLILARKKRDVSKINDDGDDDDYRVIHTTEQCKVEQCKLRFEISENLLELEMLG